MKQKIENRIKTILNGTIELALEAAFCTNSMTSKLNTISVGRLKLLTTVVVYFCLHLPIKVTGTFNQMRD